MKKNSKKIIHHEFESRKDYLIRILGIKFKIKLLDQNGNYNCKNCTYCKNCIGCINCENCTECICCKNIKNTQYGFWINFTPFL